MPMTLDGSSGMTAPQGAVYNGLQRMTAANPASGQTVDFTGIPLWAERVTMTFSGLSTTGGDNLLFRVGSGSFVTSGYAGGTVQPNNAVFNGSTSAAQVLLNFNTSNASTYFGYITCVNTTGNTWVIFGSLSDPVASRNFVYNWANTLSGSLDRVQLLTAGSNTFDAGIVNVIYE